MSFPVLLRMLSLFIRGSVPSFSDCCWATSTASSQLFGVDLRALAHACKSKYLSSSLAFSVLSADSSA